MSWQKEGRIFDPQEHISPWLVSHAAVPIAEHIEDDRYRIYFSPRDEKNYSLVASFEIDIQNPGSVLNISQQPILIPGVPGTFDDAGAMTSWLTNHGTEKWLYYIGWNLSAPVPFRNSLGLAVSRDGGNTFVRYSDGPIVDRSVYDPAMVASACVLSENGMWRMWYLSGLGWEHDGNKYQHRYHIKYAESNDGINWFRQGRVCIDLQEKGEYAISRPSVLKDSNGTYRMWYSYRGEAYRIGYAESQDGFEWIRKDREAGIDVSPTGWDSQMIEYPYVFSHKGTTMMLYNGNGYGQTGIGFAKLHE
jgi:hypothetical protein